MLDFDPTPILSRALAGGGVYADLFAETSVGRAAVREGNELVTLGESSDRGLAVRVLDERGDTRLASDAGLSIAAARAAAEAVRGSDRRERRATPALAFERHALVPAEPPGRAGLDARAALAAQADRAARAVSPHVVEVRVVVRDVEREIWVARSDGAARSARSARAIVSVEVIAEIEGHAESAHEAIGGVGGLERLAPAKVERCARLAAERAVRMARARPAPPGVMPVILAGEAGGTFVHEAVGHPLEADLVLDALSVYAERLGERIASPLLTVLDDATLPGMNGSLALDDEGSLAERTVLVSGGVLETYLHDERTARLLGGRAQGKARRESFRCRPIVRMTNTLIAPGAHDPAEILRSTPRGLYVTRMGGGEVDTVTGHFVFEASEAFLIENGSVGEPVRGATLTGDTDVVLREIDRVGSDLGFGIGTCGKDGQDVPIADGQPTLRVPELVVGGRA